MNLTSDNRLPRLSTDLGSAIQHLHYLPFGEEQIDQRLTNFNSRYTFSAKEKDIETNYSYFGARYYNSDLSIWLSVDPMSDKYPSMSPYNYCANNPVILVDPNGEAWTDIDGNKIEDHSNIKVYIFYDPKAFKGQSEAMYKEAEAKYGKGSVAMSNVTTEAEFSQDWGDMGGKDIKEVNLNYHGNNQTIMLNSGAQEYITSTGNGKSNLSGADATNVQDLPTPLGNISYAQLNLNTCKSNSKTQYPLKGSGLTLMESFSKKFDFGVVRGASGGVSYGRFTKQPEPQHFFQTWDYSRKRAIGTSRQSDFIRVGGCY